MKNTPDKKVDPAKVDAKNTAGENLDSGNVDLGKTETKKPQAEETKFNKELVKDAKNVLEILNRCKCNQIFRNSNGEYFTSHNLAVLSEKGDLKKVSEINRNVVELIVNGK